MIDAIEAKHTHNIDDIASFSNSKFEEIQEFYVVLTIINDSSPTKTREIFNIQFRKLDEAEVENDGQIFVWVSLLHDSFFTSPLIWSKNCNRNRSISARLNARHTHTHADECVCVCVFASVCDMHGIESESKAAIKFNLSAIVLNG